MSDFTIIMKWLREVQLAEELDISLIATDNGFDLEGMHLNSLEEVSSILRYEEFKQEELNDRGN